MLCALQLFDQDQSGSLETSEVFDVLQKTGANWDLREERSTLWYSHSHFLSTQCGLWGFGLFMCPFCVHCRTLQVEDLFKDMDTDGSGTIDKDEFTVFVKMASAHK